MKNVIKNGVTRGCIAIAMLLAFSACEESEDVGDVQAQIEAQKGSIENIVITNGDGNTISDTTPISLTDGDNYTINLSYKSIYNDAGTEYSIESNASASIAVAISEVDVLSISDLYSFDSECVTTTTTDNPSVTTTDYIFTLDDQTITLTTTQENYTYLNSEGKEVVMPYLEESASLTSTNVAVTSSGNSSSSYDVSVTFEVTIVGMNIAEDLSRSYSFDVTYTGTALKSTYDSYIYTKADLIAFREKVSSGENSLSAVLMNDISLAGTEWIPISTFAGTFDGNSHTISNLTINSSDSNQALFASIDGAKIIDLTLKDPTVTGSNSVGAICGSATEGAIMLRCHVDGGTVSGSGYCVGGLIGGTGNESKVTLTDCTNSGTVTGSDWGVGGVAGYVNSSTLTNCTNSGVVTGDGGYVGGVAGYVYMRSEITNCTNSGVVVGDVSRIGGVAGYVYVYSTLSNCTNSGAVTSSGWYAGGVAGYVENNSTVTDCTNSGTMTSSKFSVGGIAGRVYNESDITNCTNSGAVICSSEVVGGVVGAVYSSTITNCTNEGDVTAVKNTVGGVAGSVITSTVTNCTNSGNVAGSWNVDGVAGSVDTDSTITNCTNTGTITETT